MPKWFEEAETESEYVQIDDDTLGTESKPQKIKYDFVLVEYLEPEKPKKSEKSKKPKKIREPLQYPIVIRPTYQLQVIPKEKKIIPIYNKELYDFLYYKDYLEVPIFDFEDDYIEYYELLDVSKEKDYTQLIQWLLLPKWKRLYLFLRFRYGLLQKAISADYENPTFARMTTDFGSLCCRWFLKLYRQTLDSICGWVRYFVRLNYTQFFGDIVQVIQSFVICFLVLLFSFSYMQISTIYSETHTLSAFGYDFNVKDEIHYELGEQVILDPIYFLEEDSLDYASRVRLKSELLTNPQYRYDEDTKAVRGYGVEILPAGDYLVQIGYGDQIRDCHIIVEDTTPPDLSECDLYNTRTIRVLKGTQNIDLRGYISAGIKDASLQEVRGFDTSTLRISSDHKSINTSKTGKYSIDVVVEDKYGNATEPIRISVYVVNHL